MLAVPQPIPSTSTTLPSDITHNPAFSIETEDDDDDFTYSHSHRASISADDRFYLPVCSPVVTSQPAPIPELSPIPGKFPSGKGVGETEAKPTKRTHPLTVIQTGVFYFFSCGWCVTNEKSKRVRKEAEVANQSFRERWRYEIENRPKALRKLIKTTADNVETNIVPSLIARVSHHYHSYTGGESTPGKGNDVKSMSSEDTFEPYYSRWRGREIPRPREGTRAPPIQNFAESTSATYVMQNDLMWMMQPPPSAIWKSDGTRGPRLALADYDEPASSIEPRYVTTAAPSRPRPTIVRIPTLPSIESLASRIIEDQERETASMPQIPPAALQIASPSRTNRRVSTMPSFLDGQSKENSLDLSERSTPPFSAPGRSMSWGTATDSRSSSERDYRSGSDGTVSPVTIYSTTVPRLKSPRLTKSALATKDENGNYNTATNEMKFHPRSSSVLSDELKNLESLYGKDFQEHIIIPVPTTTPLSPRTRSLHRHSIPLSGLRI